MLLRVYVTSTRSCQSEHLLLDPECLLHPTKCLVAVALIHVNDPNVHDGRGCVLMLVPMHAAKHLQRLPQLLHSLIVPPLLTQGHSHVAQRHGQPSLVPPPSPLKNLNWPEKSELACPSPVTRFRKSSPLRVCWLSLG